MPPHDILTEMATQRFPDGTLPEVADLVRIATFLFIAGHETTARLLSSARTSVNRGCRTSAHVARPPRSHTELRRRDLRLESPIKSDFRLARVRPHWRCRHSGRHHGDAAAGAANRDPSHFGCPAELRLDRTNARHNVAFARGVHSCPGGPLARIEGRVTIERILDRLTTSGYRGSPRHGHYAPFRLRTALYLSRAPSVAPRVHCGIMTTQVWVVSSPK